jgi:hypothetical protein
MQIYTGIAFGEELKNLRRYNLGIMITPTGSKFKPQTKHKKFPCALDNGAFQYAQRGYPFMEKLFFETIDYCYRHNIKLDFIVCPDIMEGGRNSYYFSVEWASTKLKTAPNLALVVQDGMQMNWNTFDQFDSLLFSHIFVGGSVKWKWETVEDWVQFARHWKKKIHVGQVGTLKRLLRCKELGVDSVDSTSFVQNKSWGILEEYYK